jgi:hypothetical protein
VITRRPFSQRTVPETRFSIVSSKGLAHCTVFGVVISTIMSLQYGLRDLWNWREARALLGLAIPVSVTYLTFFFMYIVDTLVVGDVQLEYSFRNTAKLCSRWEDLGRSILQLQPWRILGVIV